MVLFIVYSETDFVFLLFYHSWKDRESTCTHTMHIYTHAHSQTQNYKVFKNKQVGTQCSKFNINNVQLDTINGC